MSNAVMITLIICVTLIALSLINKKKKLNIQTLYDRQMW